MSRLTIVEGNSNNKDNVRAIMVKGEKGASSYDLYVEHGGTLTEEEWLDAYLSADNYYSKDETDNLLSNKANSSTTLAGYGITDAYTKDETYSKTEIGDLSELETTDKTSIVNAINENNGKISNINGQILWTNPNPNNAISQITEITLSNDDYDVLEIFYKQEKNSRYMYFTKILKGGSTNMRINVAYSTNVFRGLTYIDDTTYQIDLPYSETTLTNIYDLAIPVYIIGYKTGIFS